MTSCFLFDLLPWLFILFYVGLWMDFLKDLHIVSWESLLLHSWGWRICCDYENMRTTKVKYLLCWDTWCWSVGADNFEVLEKRTESLRWNFLGSVSSELAHRCLYRSQHWILCWQPNLAVYKGPQVAPLLKEWCGHREQVRFCTVRSQESHEYSCSSVSSPWRGHGNKLEHGILERVQ